MPPARGSQPPCAGASSLAARGLWVARTGCLSLPHGGRAGEGGLGRAAWVNLAPGPSFLPTQSSFLSHGDGDGPDRREFCENPVRDTKRLGARTAALCASVPGSCCCYCPSLTRARAAGWGPLSHLFCPAAETAESRPQNGGRGVTCSRRLQHGPSLLRRQGRARIAEWKLPFLKGRERPSALVLSRDALFSPASPPTEPIEKDKRGHTPAPSPPKARTDPAWDPHPAPPCSARACRPHRHGPAQADKGMESLMVSIFLFYFFPHF